MEELFTPNDLTGILSYGLIALSYLMTNIFWLRVSAVVGLFLEIAYFRMTDGDLKVGIVWGLIFISIKPWNLMVTLLKDAIEVGDFDRKVEHGAGLRILDVGQRESDILCKQ